MTIHLAVLYTGQGHRLVYEPDINSALLSECILQPETGELCNLR